MSIDDGRERCQVCGVYYLLEPGVVCTDCIKRALDKAASAKTVADALKIVREECLK
ncbi:MAG: hypothetical protein DDT33_01664 [Firmicutes bacterium]|nr:hypothetical protein [Bacillota bacterium]